MNKTHGSRKRDIEMFVKIEITRGTLKEQLIFASVTKYRAKILLVWFVKLRK